MDNTQRSIEECRSGPLQNLISLKMLLLFLFFWCLWSYFGSGQSLTLRVNKRGQQIRHSYISKTYDMFYVTTIWPRDIVYSSWFVLILFCIITQIQTHLMHVIDKKRRWSHYYPNSSLAYLLWSYILLYTIKPQKFNVSLSIILQKMWIWPHPHVSISLMYNSKVYNKIKSL